MYGKSENQDLSRSQFDSARLGFLQWLRRKRMSPQFIDRHAEDLFAQACFEYSRRVSEGVEIGDPPAWIVTCAWNRTRSLLETRDYRPRLVSTESIAEPGDGRAGPEEALLDSDRGRKIRDAVKELPLYQRQLLALSYFEGESIREAGRRLRWTASKAQRAHEAAQRRLHEILDVESPSDLQLPIGLFSYLSVCSERAAGRTLPAGLEAGLDSARHRISEAGHHVESLSHRPLHASRRPGEALTRPAAAIAGRTKEIEGRGPFGRIADFTRRLATGGFGEAGTAIAGEGGGRALEVCKGLAVCVIGGSAITTALVAGGGHSAGSQANDHRPPAKVARHVGVSRKPVLEAARSAGDTFAEASTTTTATHSDASGPVERHPATAKAPKVEEAATAAPAAATDQRSQEAAETEEQFQDFDATEGSGSGSTATKSASVTESASTSTTGSGGSGVSPAKKSEEAQAAKQFHGLLE